MRFAVLGVTARPEFEGLGHLFIVSIPQFDGHVLENLMPYRLKWNIGVMIFILGTHG